MSYVFGSTFICDTMLDAKKVMMYYNNMCGTQCVDYLTTVYRDIFAGIIFCRLNSRAVLFSLLMYMCEINLL